MWVLRNAACISTTTIFSEDDTGDLTGMGYTAHAKVESGTLLRQAQYLYVGAGYVDNQPSPITIMGLTLV